MPQLARIQSQLGFITPKPSQVDLWCFDYASWGDGVASMYDRQTEKYHFPTATFFEIKRNQLVTFVWGSTMAIAPLFINLVTNAVLSFYTPKKMTEYFAESAADATLTGFAIAAIALSNSYFNNAKPVGKPQLTWWTYWSMLGIAALTLINVITHVVSTVMNTKDPTVYYFAICITASIALLSYVLQVSYVKDITYRAREKVALEKTKKREAKK